jgi:MoaA/NifB/PqqE/SkfB family radical SAM enzyme
MANVNPKIVVFFLTYRCNSRCIMCHAWQKQNLYPELSLSQIERIFSAPCLSNNIEIVNMTGGEPTLRKDLVEVVNILLNRCKKLRRIDMPTNGINKDEVIDKIEQILTVLLPTDVKLAVTVSLDGIGEVHENVRRISGVFNRVQETIFELREMTSYWSNLLFGINTTISNMNYDNLDKIREFGLRNGIGINYTLGAISEIGVESVKIGDEFMLNDGQRDKVIEFIENLLRKDSINALYANFMLQYLKTGKRKPICAFRSRKSFLLEPSASVYLCGNYKEFYLGNLLEKPFREIWRNTRKIKRSSWKRCFSCASNCYIDEVIDK